MEGSLWAFLVCESQKISPLQLACHSVHCFWLFTWLLSQVGSWNQRCGDFSGNLRVLLVLLSSYPPEKKTSSGTTLARAGLLWELCLVDSWLLAASPPCCSVF